MHAIQCELCKSWEHINCIREVDRPSEGLVVTQTLVPQVLSIHLLSETWILKGHNGFHG